MDGNVPLGHDESARTVRACVDALSESEEPRNDTGDRDGDCRTAPSLTSSAVDGDAGIGAVTARLRLPVLRATPFRLRRFRMDDLAAVRAAASDPLIPLITTVPAPFTEEKGQQFIERQWSRARDGVGYSFAIADEATDTAVGQIGLWPTRHGRASIGYWVVGAARGRGAARHALRALSRWALDDLSVPRLELYVEPRNLASLRVAERAGFRREGLLRSWETVGRERRNMFMYSLLPDDLQPFLADADDQAAGPVV